MLVGGSPNCANMCISNFLDLTPTFKINRLHVDRANTIVSIRGNNDLFVLFNYDNNRHTLFRWNNSPTAFAEADAAEAFAFAVAFHDDLVSVFEETAGFA